MKARKSTTGPPGGERVPGRLRASDHTERMLAWWTRARIERADLAVRRLRGEMIWHRDLRLDRLPLAWVRAENAVGAEVYIRPARGGAWPIVFLDDVDVRLALRVARKYPSAVIQTSPEGGCHLWLACDRPFEEPERKQAQCWLASRLNADTRLTSGEHLGRLAGLKNWKRGGVWVNVCEASWPGPCWTPIDIAPTAESQTRSVATQSCLRRGTDTSASGRDWAWVCRALESGACPSHLYLRLVESARERRGRDAERYARTTLERARRHVQASTGIHTHRRSSSMKKFNS